MSDEAAKRRELRKQRILGNSENRLKRILNKEGERVWTADYSQGLAASFLSFFGSDLSSRADMRRMHEGCWKLFRRAT